ncbi:MAG: lipopolysaccharide biosynthesis regulator YciM [Deltaproteobacteria bacterium]|nr:lipopolysaccharide biosynthesis regulator YciM [Deltaproteobacteria bacterium]
MLVRLLFIILLIVISLFCWISLENPVDIEFFFFGESTHISVSALMISSFVLGAILVFVSTLTRDIKRAFQEFRRSRETKKGEAIKEELNKGMDHFIRGDFAKAKVHFSEVLKKDPSHIDLYLRLSEMELRDGKEDEALHWLEQARLIDMKNVTILLKEAEVYQRMKRYDDAIRTLNRVTGLDENNLKALKSLREINLENQRWEEAIRLQKLIIKLTKGKQAEEEETRFYLGLKYERGRDLLARGGEDPLAAALKEAKEIVREMKTFQPGFVLLGDVYLRTGRWASAGKIWGKSFIRFKSIIVLLRLEELYLGREDPSTLIRIYQRALEKNPEQWVIRFYYAKLCLRLEMLDEALEALDEISLGQKDFPALHRLLAEIALHRKDFDRAAHEFEKTFELSGKSFLPFSCTTCERESQEWLAYCPQCHQWNTYTIKEGEPIATLAPRSIPEQMHFRF